MGQEPGDEPRRPRTPLLAPFITHDVLLRVNNSLLRRQTTLSEGAGAAGRSWSCGGSPYGLAAGGVHGGCQARGATRCRPGPAALCTPSNPNPSITVSNPHTEGETNDEASTLWSGGSPLVGNPTRWGPRPDLAYREGHTLYPYLER